MRNWPYSDFDPQIINNLMSSRKMKKIESDSSESSPQLAPNPISEHEFRSSLRKTSKGDLDLKELVKFKSDEVKNRRRLQRNLFVLAISFMFLLTAFLSMANLQSSLNKKGGLGAYSLAVLYLAYAIASLFVPSLVIPRLGCKWTLIISTIGYHAYIAAQFYPTFFTLIPAAVLLGVCASPLWSAQSMYMTKISEEYALVTGKPKDEVLPRFFGLFFLIFQTSNVWGNLIAARLLAKDDDSQAQDSSILLQETRRCGVYHCPGVPLEALQLNTTEVEAVRPAEDVPDMGKVYILATIFLATSVTAAVILIFFLDGLNDRAPENEGSDSTRSSVYSRAIATVKNMKNPLQLLMIPMTLWTGIEQGFISADMTAAYISCAWSVHQIGYVFICYGLTNSASSFVFGRLSKHIGRPIVFSLAHCFHLGALAISWSWIPNGETPAMFFVTAGLWGLGDGILTSQINALNGLIFPTALEAAFSHNRLWNSVGYLISYLVATKVCMRTKLPAMLGLITVSILCYLIVEWTVARQAKNMLDIEGKGQSQEQEQEAKGTTTVTSTKS